MNTMRYLCSLFGASTDDLVTAETPAGFYYFGFFYNILMNCAVFMPSLIRAATVQQFSVTGIWPLKKVCKKPKPVSELRV